MFEVLKALQIKNSLNKKPTTVNITIEYLNAVGCETSFKKGENQ